MFKGKGTTFVAVAFQAGFFVGLSVFSHPGPYPHSPSGGLRAVRVVAIGALHEAFVYAMLDWHRKLRPNVGMAAIAEIGLWLGKQLLGCCRLVHGMAVGADNISGSV